MNSKIKKSALSTILSLCFLCLCSAVYAQDLANPKVQRALKKFWDASDPNSYTTGSFVFEHGQKQIMVYGTDHSIKKPDDAVFDDMELKLRQHSPSRIYIEVPSIAMRSREESIQFGGDVSFTKYYGYINRTETLFWDCDWGTKFNVLSKKYTRDLIFLVAAFTIFQQHSVSNEAFDLFYKEFITNLVYGGYPINFKERDPKYFKALFKKRFGMNYNTEGDLKYRNLIDSKLTRGVYKDIVSDLNQIREKFMLGQLLSAMKDHNKIFIQCGAKHRESLKNILPILFQQDKAIASSKTKRVLFKDETIDSNQYYILRAGNKHVMLIADFDGDRGSNIFPKSLTDEVLNFKPDRILIPSFQDVYSTAEQSFKFSGKSGLLRYIGINKSLKVYKWQPDWTLFYNKMMEKHSRSGVMSVHFAHLFIRDQYEITSFQTFEDYWKNMSIQLIFEGVPFSYFDLVLPDFFNGLPKEVHQPSPSKDSINAFIASMQHWVEGPPRSPLHNSMIAWKSSALLNALEYHLAHSNRILVQGSKAEIESVKRTLLDPSF